MERILESIYSAFQKHEDRNINALMKRDFVFHMTDWENDLYRLNQLFQNPTGYSKTEAKDIVAGFLLHASSHIKMAVSLLLDFVPFDFEDPRKNRG